MRDAAGLLGTWSMTSWKRETIKTGEKIDALGPDPVGYINYGTDGRFSALVVSSHRPAPAKLPLSESEKLRLFDSMLAYAGTYTAADEKVVHHVDASWNQIWTGTDQVRFYKLAGDKLTISTDQIKDPYTGLETVHRLEFKRVRN